MKNFNWGLYFYLTAVIFAGLVASDIYRDPLMGFLFILFGLTFVKVLFKGLR